jgi:hypothetical protein
MANNNRMISTIEQFKKNGSKFRLVPLGSTASLPIPLRIRGKVCLAFLFYTGKRLNEKEKIKIFRPNAKIVIDYPRGKIIYYRDYCLLDEFKNDFKDKKWDEPIGMFPHEKIESLTLKEYNEKKNKLLAQYDEAIDLFLNNKDDAEFKEDFRNQFYNLCEPCLLPFMNKVGKNFFDWLRLDEDSVEQES